jgi:hypothetical protein
MEEQNINLGIKTLIANKLEHRRTMEPKNCSEGTNYHIYRNKILLGRHENKL